MGDKEMDETTPLSKDPDGIGRRMIRARVDKNITLRQLSEMSGVKATALSAIETGKTKGFSLHDLNRARRALGLSLLYVMDGEEVKNERQ
jgi:transcriptional regulator with XRE-family HTH domain